MQRETQEMAVLPSYTAFDATPTEDAERDAVISREKGFHLRPPPAPHQLGNYITSDDDLFQTIHMGAAHVDAQKWRLVVTGLVSHPFSLNLEQLRALPAKTVTAFHECYGSPLKPPITALWRVGNVQWTGVPLKYLLGVAGVSANASFVWSDGLDSGQFGGIKADRYQKDLPLGKAVQDDVLVAWEMNGNPLSARRGGPVRLIVPGWFGTNSTKWLCRLTVQNRRSPSHFTTTFYNEHYPPDDPSCDSRPVWEVQPNALIVTPSPGSKHVGPDVLVEGWAWSKDGVVRVDVIINDGETREAVVESRTDFSWQKYSVVLQLGRGQHELYAQAVAQDGRTQPVDVGRNHVHRVAFEVM